MKKDWPLPMGRGDDNDRLDQRRAVEKSARLEGFKA